MNTIHDSYLDLITYKQGYQLYFLLQKQQFQNTIIYGCQQSGKSTMIQTILKELFGSSKQIHQQKNIYHTNSKYIFFNCRQIGDKQDMFQTIKTIVKSYNYFQKSYQLIILDHFEEISITFQNMFKVLLEKSYETSRFLIITSQLNKIVDPIQSRCILFRFKKPHHFDIVNTYKTSNEFSMKQLDIKPHIESPLDIISTEIIQLCQTSFSLQKIKQICDKIELLQIPITKLFHKLLRDLSASYPTSTMIKITSAFAFYQHKLRNSFRDILYLESILIRIYKILHESI